MKEAIRIEIPYYKLLYLGVRNSGREIIDRFKYLIDNNVVLHNDKLNTDFVVREIMWTEDFNKHCYIIEIVIDLLNETDKDILKQLNTLKESSGELLTQRGVRNE